jgi:D-alanyl-D-alanine dipeptidase
MSTRPTTSKPSPKAPPTATARPPARASIPPVSALARADGLIDVRTVVPDALIDLRYATTNNFVGVRLYPTDARCLVHTTMAAGLAAAATALRRQGLLIVFWDCYRPHAVQIRMFQAVPNPNWVARPTAYARSHESGRSVDITLARVSTTSTCAASLRIDGLCRLDMGTDFDDFSARALAFATTGVSADAQANRTRLRQALNVGGLIVYSGEWWHFDGPGAAVNRPVLHAPVN